MAAIAWSDVAALPGVAALGVSIDGQIMILADVNTAIDPTRFDGEDGPTTKMARALFAAHMASVNSTGPLTGHAIAGVASRTYAMPNFTDRELQRTAYGRAYLTLAAPKTRVVLL